MAQITGWVQSSRVEMARWKCCRRLVILIMFWAGNRLPRFDNSVTPTDLDIGGVKLTVRCPRIARARRAASRSLPAARTEGCVTSSPAVKNLARREPTTITRMSELPETRLMMSSSSIQNLGGQLS